MDVFVYIILMKFIVYQNTVEKYPEALLKNLIENLCFYPSSHRVSFHHHYSKDVRLPVQLQRAMAAEAEAAREARAKVIAAEGEQKAARALREASEVIGDSPAALQLRYLQVSGPLIINSLNNN